ncbi:WD repeat-containing protein 74-like [Oscarella lobularis]|uniref:WD repeat-containing protein 74-like n=1 Tax=Oscarella lobularis TaxID=121494 RepID=UPI003313E9AF
MELPATWLGTRKGTIKEVDLSGGTFTNCSSIEEMDAAKEVRALEWFDDTTLVVAHKNGPIKTFDVESKQFRPFVDAKDEVATALAWPDEKSILYCTTTGKLALFDEKIEPIIAETSIGTHVACLRQNPLQRCLVASGGKENDLKIYDLNNGMNGKKFEPIFRAKNVRNDRLDLRVPVWVTAVAFQNDSTLVTGTAHHQVRVYDTKAQRRPVLSVEHGDASITTIDTCPRDGNAVVMGNGHGLVLRLDLRNGGGVVGRYKGPAGCVRSVRCWGPVVVSAGLDRMVWVHEGESRKVLKKIYAKQEVSCVALGMGKRKEKRSETKEENDDDAADSDADEIWNQMDIIPDLEPKKKKKRTTKA